MKHAHCQPTGLRPLRHDEPEELYEVIRYRYERGSMILEPRHRRVVPAVRGQAGGERGDGPPAAPRARRADGRRLVPQPAAVQEARKARQRGRVSSRPLQPALVATVTPTTHGGSALDAGRNETAAGCNERACLLCGTPLEVQSTGRPRRFCSTAHRVRYHRLRKRGDRAEASPAATAPPAQPTLVSSPSGRGRGERLEALRKLAGVLDGLRPVGRVAELRRLAEYAGDLLAELDGIAGVAWALDELGEVAWALERLQEHRRTLDRLVELDDLADDVDELARCLRQARRHRDDLDGEFEELEELEEDLA